MKSYDQVVDSFISHSTDINAFKLVKVSRNDNFSLQNIVHLAKGLANSGEIISSANLDIFDIPSTGGPSSLSTLICPLILSAYNKKVLKLGVPGRPAGGIDVLAQINNYKYSLSISELNELIKKGNYVHFLANNTFTPADITLFNYRKQNDAIHVPNLVIASILAKKLAMGVKNVGLDIRISEFGNFGLTNEDGLKNAEKFNKAAKILDIKSICYITNGNNPQQPYIGRGESLLALNKIFNQNYDSLLEKHFNDCLKMSLSLIGESISIQQNFIPQLLNEFKKNIENQSGDFGHFIELSEEVEYNHKYEIIAEDTGFLQINLKNIRESINEIQQQFANTDFPDPCGIILKVTTGNLMNKGEIIATYRCEKEYSKRFETLLKRAFSIQKEYLNKNKIILI